MASLGRVYKDVRKAKEMANTQPLRRVRRWSPYDRPGDRVHDVRYERPKPYTAFMPSRMRAKATRAVKRVGLGGSLAKAYGLFGAGAGGGSLRKAAYSWAKKHGRKRLK